MMRKADTLGEGVSKLISSGTVPVSVRDCPRFSFQKVL